MTSRLELQTELEKKLGTKNVYYQPPESIKMSYPAIVYTKSNISGKFANGSRYTKMTMYKIIVISKRPDDPVIDKIMDMPYCSYDRHYVSDNLNHDVLSLYY